MGKLWIFVLRQPRELKDAGLFCRTSRGFKSACGRQWILYNFHLLRNFSFYYSLNRRPPDTIGYFVSELKRKMNSQMKEFKEYGNLNEFHVSWIFSADCLQKNSNVQLKKVFILLVILWTHNTMPSLKKLLHFLSSAFIRSALKKYIYYF